MPLRIEAALRGIRNPVIVEVGANDGKTGDPLFQLIRRRKGCSALLIEPLPHLFARLEATYRGYHNCRLEKVPIGSTVGALPLFYIASEARVHLPELPVFFEELASFDKQKVAALLGDAGSEFLREEVVSTVPLRELLKTHDMSKVDLLQVDTEGHDYEVLRTFPFEAMLPRIVIFEHTHLCDHDRSAALRFLADFGYRVERWGKDFCCFSTPSCNAQSA